jgi:hypothetical protein
LDDFFVFTDKVRDGGKSCNEHARREILKTQLGEDELTQTIFLLVRVTEEGLMLAFHSSDTPR